MSFSGSADTPNSYQNSRNGPKAADRGGRRCRRWLGSIMDGSFGSNCGEFGFSHFLFQVLCSLFLPFHFHQPHQEMPNRKQSASRGRPSYVSKTMLYSQQWVLFSTLGSALQVSRLPATTLFHGQHRLVPFHFSLAAKTRRPDIHIPPQTSKIQVQDASSAGPGLPTTLLFANSDGSDVKGDMEC